MTIAPADLAEAKRLAEEATPGRPVAAQSWAQFGAADAAFIAHCNPAFVRELVREVERLMRVEEAAEEMRNEVSEYGSLSGRSSLSEIVWHFDQKVAALANPAAEDA